MTRSELLPLLNRILQRESERYPSGLPFRSYFTDFNIPSDNPRLCGQSLAACRVTYPSGSVRVWSWFATMALPIHVLDNFSEDTVSRMVLVQIQQACLYMQRIVWMGDRGGLPLGSRKWRPIVKVEWFCWDEQPLDSDGPWKLWEASG